MELTSSCFAEIQGAQTLLEWISIIQYSFGMSLSVETSFLGHYSPPYESSGEKFPSDLTMGNRLLPSTWSGFMVTVTKNVDLVCEGIFLEQFDTKSETHLEKIYRTFWC